LRPTWSELLATPFGLASVREFNSSRGISIARKHEGFAGSHAFAAVPTPKGIAVARPSEPTSTIVAVVCAWIAAPLFPANDRCTVASYFAWIGQIGMQLALAQHAGLSSRAAELRA
jgi:hypothetical protein